MKLLKMFCILSVIWYSNRVEAQDSNVILEEMDSLSLKEDFGIREMDYVLNKTSEIRALSTYSKFVLKNHIGLQRFLQKIKDFSKYDHTKKLFEDYYQLQQNADKINSLDQLLTFYNDQSTQTIISDRTPKTYIIDRDQTLFFELSNVIGSKKTDILDDNILVGGFHFTLESAFVTVREKFNRKTQNYEIKANGLVYGLTFLTIFDNPGTDFLPGLQIGYLINSQRLPLERVSLEVLTNFDGRTLYGGEIKMNLLPIPFSLLTYYDSQSKGMIYLTGIRFNLKHSFRL